MERTVTAVPRKGTDVERGDLFTFVTYVDGISTELTGSVVVMMPSSKARALGLTKSKRQRLGLLFKVEGHEGPCHGLFYKDRGQVKPAVNPSQRAVRAAERIKLRDETLEVTEEVLADLKATVNEGPYRKVD